MSFNELLYEQSSTITSIPRIVINLKKLGRQKYTPTIVQTRIDHLKETWVKARSLDVQLHALATEEQQKAVKYFSEQQLLEAEDEYYNALDYLEAELSTFKKPTAAPLPAEGHSTFLNDTNPSQSVAFPRIKLPDFDGRYSDWISFRDYFETLVVNNDHLPNVLKFHYLKGTLKGEAASLIKNLTISDENFQTAWDKLKSRYDKRRSIITNYFIAMFNAPAVTTASVKDLKKTRETIDDAVESIVNLNENKWDSFVSFLVYSKLDPDSKKECEMFLRDQDNFPSYNDLCKFLDYRISSLEAMQTVSSVNNGQEAKLNKHSHSGAGKSKSRVNLSTTGQQPSTNSKSSCILCAESHALYKCEKFRTQSVDQRLLFVHERKLCSNCLNPGHRPQGCRSKYSCNVCHKKHHSLLHDPLKAQSKPKLDEHTLATEPEKIKTEQVPVASGSRAVNMGHLHHVRSQIEKLPQGILATAWVTIRSSTGRAAHVRALIDSGAETSYVKESVAQLLHAPKIRSSASLTGFGDVEIGSVTSMIELVLVPKIASENPIKIRAGVRKQLTSWRPRKDLDSTQWPHLSGLDFADPNLASPEPIELLLGVEEYASILREGLRRGPPGTPMGQKTILGWIISGSSASGTAERNRVFFAHGPNADTSNTLSNLDNDFKRFWELEEIPKNSPLSEEELRCEEHFIATHKRTADGRYIVRLPFKGNVPPSVGLSYRIAEKRLLSLENRFKRNPTLMEPYHKFMREYEDLNHMTVTSLNATDSTAAIFLPHHPVLKDSSTTRLRVVFNASSHTSNGATLNEHLMTGPKLQADLPAIILKWRCYPFALTADITKMYRQILVASEDTKYQQILWRYSPQQPIMPYRLLTVTYGTSAAPYLAIRVLHQLAEDEGKQYPSAAAILKNHFYVDDALFGAFDSSEATQLREDLTQLLARGGFKLLKWMASHPRLLSNIPQEERETTKSRFFDSTQTAKVLGISWAPNDDAFVYNVSRQETCLPTKRIIASISAKLFDPLGWLAPIVITAKILLQDVWILSIGWDDTLPETLAQQWAEYSMKLSALTAITIPRWIHLTSLQVACQFHGFADASTRAYAAAVYVRVVESDEIIHTHLLMAKTKVAPIKTVSIPKLELCAAVLLSQLLNYVIDAMELPNASVYAWTDSTTVRAWLNKHPSHWRQDPFVSNRVSQIQTQLPNVKWHHVPTADNPADCASRGLPAEDINHHPLWWEGPDWLKKSPTSWPKQKEYPIVAEPICKAPSAQVHMLIPKHEWSLPNDISSWPRLLRVTAYCLRFVSKNNRKGTAKALCLSADEIRQARIVWVRLIQRYHYDREIRALQAKTPIARGSPIQRLNPFLDEVGLLRIGGRLQNAPLQFDERHPIILPRHRVSELIVEQAHLRSLHGGPQLTTRVLRQNYWIVGGRTFIRKIINKCIPCFRERATRTQQLMGNLPASRVTPARPFVHSGLDYAGPFNVNISKGRGQKSYKAYIALFVCLATRAIHLELVSDYTTESFLAALRRFVSRRGLPSDLYSDNGTNFQGANKELQTCFNKIRHDPLVSHALANDEINWHFIPPGAPHFGGLWEAGVKSTKHHLRRILRNITFTFEEFITLLSQVEASLNSRPIGPLTTDPDDTVSLTPGHFLIGAPLTSIAEPSLLELNPNRLSRWQMVQQCHEHFWKRWAAEYIHSLQQRPKWSQEGPNVQIDDLVIIRNPVLPPSKWLLGRIKQCHTGKDGLVRVVTIRTAQSELKRPITQICVLPIQKSINDFKEPSSCATKCSSAPSEHDDGSS